MSPDARHNLIFSHEGNARAAASVILIGVVVALIGSVFMVIGPRFQQAPPPTGNAYTGGHRRRFASSDMRRARMGPASSRFGQILIRAASCAGKPWRIPAIHLRQSRTTSFRRLRLRQRWIANRLRKMPRTAACRITPRRRHRSSKTRTTSQSHQT